MLFSPKSGTPNTPRNQTPSLICGNAQHFKSYIKTDFTENISTRIFAKIFVDFLACFTFISSSHSGSSLRAPTYNRCSCGTNSKIFLDDTKIKLFLPREPRPSPGNYFNFKKVFEKVISIGLTSKRPQSTEETPNGFWRKQQENFAVPSLL